MGRLQYAGDFDLRSCSMFQVVILVVSDTQGGRRGWEDSSEDLQYLQHLYSLHHLHRDRILASPSQQMEVRPDTDLADHTETFLTSDPSQEAGPPP